MDRVATDVFSVVTELFGPILRHKFYVAIGFGLELSFCVMKRSSWSR